MNERHIKWYTPWPDREFEMLAFGNGGGLPLVLYPTSFGRYFQNKDFGLVGSNAAELFVETVIPGMPSRIETIHSHAHCCTARFLDYASLRSE